MAKILDYWFVDGRNEIATDRPLKVNICGFLINEAEDFISNRPPRSDYMMIYIQSGKGFSIIDGKKHHISVGDLIIFKPGSPLNYLFEKNTRHYYIHFSGNSIALFLKEIGIERSGVYHIGNTDTFNTNIVKMRIALLKYKPAFETYCNSIFLAILGDIAPLINEKNNRCNLEKSDILPAMNEMFNNYNKNLPIEHYAKICGMSVSYFKHIFAQKNKISALKYLTAIRMDRARSMLASGNYSVKSVAESVGYNDPLYFSRAFKKHFGFPPTKTTSNP